MQDIEAIHCTADELLQITASAEQHSTHPIAQSLLTAARGKNLTLTTPEEYEEISGHGIRALIDGKEVLVGNARLMEQRIISYQQSSTIGTIVYTAVNGQYLGNLRIADQLKPDAEKPYLCSNKTALAKSYAQR